MTALSLWTGGRVSRGRRAAGRQMVGLALFCATVLIPACASRVASDGEPEGEGGGGDANVTIVVNNNLSPPTDASVWIVPQGTRQTLLGSVAPGQRTSLRYVHRRGITHYRLRARPTGGREIVSNQFSLQPGDEVRWELSANVAIVVGD